MGCTGTIHRRDCFLSMIDRRLEPPPVPDQNFGEGQTVRPQAADFTALCLGLRCKRFRYRVDDRV
jgi:hypothetical protein